MLNVMFVYVGEREREISEAVRKNVKLFKIRGNMRLLVTEI